MRLFKRRDAGGAAVAERPEGAAVEFVGDTEALLAEIEALSESTRSARDPVTERRLLGLRHLAGIRLLDSAPSDPKYPAPDYARLPEVPGLPDIARSDLTPALLRAGILRDGCLLVRGLVDRDRALRFAAQIDRSFGERDLQDDGGTAAEGYYEEFKPDARFGDVDSRPWIKQGGGVLAADSPMLSFEMFELFRGAGLSRIVSEYLGEPALISAHKTTLRKAEPSIGGAWHQDGKFMGEVRALNLWLSLSRCGDLAPGLDVVPRRLEHFAVTQTDEAMLDYQVSNVKAAEAAGDRPIIRPIFEPGDALFFDERFLHQTGSDPSMPNPRYAIENWFFGGSGFPADYAPIAV
ncbi:MAG: phytanoyl-CoA dioxygenase family protein [Solirubrobacteraceae bacterium]